MAGENGRVSPEQALRVAQGGDVLYREMIAIAELYAEL